jgi:ABC-type sugar transport system ATPase subunit
VTEGALEMARSSPELRDLQRHSRQPGDKVVLEARALRKNFGGIRAVDDVSFALRDAEILGIVGDNGAGKSTLIKIITGAYRKDGGELLLNGEPIEIESTRHAREIGLETVYQSSGLVEVMDAPANLFLAREALRPGWLGRLFGLIDKRRMRAETRDLLKTLQIEVKNLNAPVQTLSGGQQQSVAVGRAAYWKGRIIILDEPANNIGVDQQKTVLRLVLQIRDTHGIAFIMISHNMEHIFAVADRVIVMRNGRIAGEKAIAETTRNEIVGLITGADA